MYIRTFNRVLAAAVSATWAMIPTPSIGASITVTDASCSSYSASNDGAGNVTITCNGSVPSTSCSISGPTSIGAAGGSITLNLSAGCGTAAVSGGKSVQSAGGSTWMDNIPANTLATAVTWTYSAPNANPFTITQAGTGSTGGGGGSTDVASACAAAGYNAVQQYEMGWANSRITTKGFNISNVAVFHFRTPAQVAPGATGKIAGIEYATGAKLRHAVLSTVPCDFGKAKPASIWGPFMYADNGNPTVFFTVGGTSTTAANAIAPNTDYYFNVKNDPSACSTNCDMYMELSKPLGL